MKEQKRGRKIAMTPEELDAHLGVERTCTAATLGSDGSPHATALWFVWDGSHVWLYSITRAQRWADLRRDPRIAVLVEAGDGYMELRGAEIRGRVEVVGDVPRTGGDEPAVAAAERLWADKYQDGAAEMFHDGGHAWLRLTPEKISSWDFRKLGNA